MARGGSDGLVALAVVITIVVMALKYIAIAAGIGIVVFALFYLFKWLYIGKVKDSKADPLFTQAAKEAVKHKSFKADVFQQRYSLSDERMRYISTQLTYAGILSEKGVIVNNQWGLHSIFKHINTENDFFLSAIEEEVQKAQDAIAQQIKKESNEVAISILTTLNKNVRGEIMVDYLSLKQASASPEEINAITEQINAYTSSFESLSIVEDNTTLAEFNSFCSLLDSTNSARIWSSKHNELKIIPRSFSNIKINEQVVNVPFIENKDLGVYFYPSFVIVSSLKERRVQTVHVLNYNEIEVKTRSYLESKGTWFNANDADESHTTWLHTCKDGSPDLRYSYNPATTYYHFYAAELSGLRLEIISGDSNAIEHIEKAFYIICNINNRASRSVLIPGSNFHYLDKHDWKEVNPSSIKLEDGSILPAWPQIEISSRTAISTADKAIQEAYFAIRDDFLNGKFYDLSDPNRTNYAFVLFFDLIAAYNNGNSDIRKLCEELDVLTISCGKTERHIKGALSKSFKYGSKPEEDKDFVSAYFNIAID